MTALRWLVVALAVWGGADLLVVLFLAVAARQTGRAARFRAAVTRGRTPVVEQPVHVRSRWTAGRVR